MKNEQSFKQRLCIQKVQRELFLASRFSWSPMTGSHLIPFLDICGRPVSSLSLFMTRHQQCTTKSIQERQMTICHNMPLVIYNEMKSSKVIHYRILVDLIEDRDTVMYTKREGSLKIVFLKSYNRLQSK